MAEGTLVVRAAPKERERLRRVMWIRVSNALAFLLPVAVLCAMWASSGGSAGAGIADDGSLDVLGGDVFALVLPMWISFGLLGAAVGGFCAALAVKAWGAKEEAIRFTPEGLERDYLRRKVLIPWKDVTQVDVAADHLVVRSTGASCRLRLDWAGPEQMEAASLFIKARVPRDRFLPAATGVERFLEGLGKVLPFLFAALLAMIAALSVYWAFRPRQ